MESSSVIYSIGTALNRAKDNDLPVTVLVANDWVDGRVVAVDSHGLVLETDRGEHCVVRLQAVNAIRTGSNAPNRADRFATVGVA